MRSRRLSCSSRRCRPHAVARAPSQVGDAVRRPSWLGVRRTLKLSHDRSTRGVRTRGSSLSVTARRPRRRPVEVGYDVAVALAIISLCERCA